MFARTRAQKTPLRRPLQDGVVKMFLKNPVAVCLKASILLIIGL